MTLFEVLGIVLGGAVAASALWLWAALATAKRQDEELQRLYEEDQQQEEENAGGR